MLGLWLPLTIYHVVMRTVRVVHRGGMEGFLPWIDVYKSDVLFHLGLLFAGLALFGLVRSRGGRIALMVALQLGALTVTVLELLSFNFFMRTGSTLDFQLIWFSISQAAETWEVVASETATHIMAMMIGSIAATVFLPWLIAWVVAKFTTPRTVRSAMVPPLYAALAVLGFGLSLTPPLAERSYVFARNATVNIGVSGIESFQEALATPNQEATTDTTNATLMPRATQSKKRNVVIILLESTRAKSVSLYNPDLDTTPHLVELAKNSLVAEYAYAVVPHTSKALVAALCGIEPRLHMPISEAMPDGIPGRCLAELLAEQGYQTGFFQSATQRFENRPTLTKNMGYEKFVPLEKMSKKGFDKANYFGPEDDVMLEPSEKWIDEIEGEPFLLTYLTLTPHHDYLAPKRYGRHDFVEDDELNRYLNSVHYVDAFVNNVVEMFKRKGLYEDTIFVVMGDHGEGFREHGRSQHDNVIWEEGIRVPLLIHDPSRWKGGERTQRLVNQLDIVPTVADLLDFEIRDATFPGTSIAKLDEDRTMRAHCWYERRCMASINKREKFIYHFEQRPDEFFDLAEDPDEKNDILGSIDDASQRRRDLIVWRSRVNAMYRAHNQDRLDKHVFEERPELTTELDATFGNWARLIGVDAPTEPVEPGSRVKVTYYFEVLEDFPDEWNLFVHGEAKIGMKKMKNLDHIPVDGLYPLEDWKPGQIIADEQSFAIPKSARDEFVVWLGFYHKEEGRAVLTGSVATDGENRARAAVIELQDPREIRRAKARERIEKARQKRLQKKKEQQKEE